MHPAARTFSLLMYTSNNKQISINKQQISEASDIGGRGGISKDEVNTTPQRNI